MKTQSNISPRRPLASLCLGIALGSLTLAPLHADDTEIYVGNNHGLSSIKANMLIIVDTSGSMASEVTTQVPYDAATTYSGCFESDRVYWSTSSPSSSCSTSKWFESIYNRCQASITAMASSGFFQGRAGRFHKNSWRSLTTKSNKKKRDVECQSDSGVHGKLTGDAAKWASNGGSGWTTSSGSEVNWTNTGRHYTFYSGNYMNYMKNASTITRTRLEIVQDVIADLVDSTDEVNIGLMRFDRWGSGGMVTYAMEDITANRPAFKAEAYSYQPAGNTPLSETLYEATLYFRGAEWDYGDSSSPVHSVIDSRKPTNTNEYKSPIEYQCQKSNIVLLSDGNPVSDTGANNRIPNLPGFKTNIGTSCVNEHGDDDGMCLDELAEYLATVDQAPHLIDNQVVTTFTVGFAIDHPLLKDTARRGGGSYYTADDAVQLTNAFTNIVNEILAQDATFSAPAVAVNAFNRTTHRNSLYFTLFKPDSRPHWNGNLKKYELGFETDATSGETVAKLKDKFGNDAVDPATGFFADNSSSFWHPAGSPADGANVNKGGAAVHLELPRKVYTVTGSSLSNISLSNTAHALHESNTLITEAMLNLTAGATDPSRDELLQWARGVDIDGEFGRSDNSRPIFGDPLHGQATAVQYGGSDTAPDLAVFFSTNDGYLHAIDEDTGKELFAFVPPEVLPNLIDLYDNNHGTPRPYGLDGSLMTWVNDINEDGVITGSDHVYLYGGMRRGGHSYYALDVTDRTRPKLLWRINNDPDGDGTPSGDFAELGQTWSDPVLGKIKLNNVEKTVLIFGGGYDPDQDANNTAFDDDMGRAVYIVDATTGARLWWAGPTASGANLSFAQMTNSIPSAVNAIDIDSDGFVDRIYVGDTRGQMWRFDLNNDNSGAADLATGGRIWALGDGTTAGNRRFYYPPDIALSGGFPGVGPHLTLVIGSGYRAHPLNETIEDRIYMLRDDDIFTAPATYTTQTEANLYNATANVIGEGTQAQRQAALDALASAHGWYIQLTDNGTAKGEKVLSSPLILNNTAIITSFTPQDDSAVVPAAVGCAPRAGTGQVYYMNLNDARPVENFDGIGQDSELTESDRTLELSRSGIPPSPTLVITPEHNTLLVGPEIVPDPLTATAIRTYWHDR